MFIRHKTLNLWAFRQFFLELVNAAEKHFCLLQRELFLDVKSALKVKNQTVVDVSACIPVLRGFLGLVM